MTKLNRIFYIYSQASMAALCVGGAALELFCFAYFTYIDAPALQWFTGAAVAGFALIAALNVHYIIKSEARRAY